ncbi:hypothetical protein [Leclercia adecarboxylata]|uniref:hypothetical protein n=1 Tax=Leclercia adecarboxylata TaxID=83655 RepID=UPI00384F2232
MKIFLLFKLLVLMFVLIPGLSYACGDNEYEQCWSVNLGPLGEAKDCKCFPKIGGVPGQVGEAAKGAINPIIDEVRKSPQAIQECLGDINKCVVQIISQPLATTIQIYLDGLYKQSEGRARSFSPEFIALAQPYFNVDLRSITYADDINTGMGMSVSYCDRIFFIGHGNLWQDPAELHLVLHEIEHIVQCQGRGKSTYLAEYILKAGLDVIKNGRFDVHDVHDYEIAAEDKANRLTGILWSKIQSKSVPIPNVPNGVPADPALRAGTLPATAPRMLQMCQTFIGSCPVPPVIAAPGSDCFCNTFNGPVAGKAF